MDTSAGPLGVQAGLGDVAVAAAAAAPASQRGATAPGDAAAEPSPMSSKTRSLSDGGGTPGPKLSPSPLILDAARRTSKDDSAIRGPATAAAAAAAAAAAVPALPVTPSRVGFAHRGGGLSHTLRLPHQGGMAAGGAGVATAAVAGQSSPSKPAPLSPKLDHSHIYASPSSTLPRRSRGLDFSRAATSLHHSTLAEQSSPDSSPTIGGRGAMNIPGAARRHGEFGPAETTTSLWSMMGNHEKMHISSSVGSSANQMLGSDSSSSSDGDDLMDEDMDEPYITTPQIQKTAPIPGLGVGGNPPPWAPAGSPAFNSLLSFQQRQRPRKQHKKRLRGPIGLGFSSILGGGSSSGGGSLGASKSPPSGREASNNPHSRRESISWAANQLNLSGNESDDGMRPPIMESVESVMGAPGREGQTEVIRRVVTRRGNLLPKTKAFARMRAALAEEGAPVDSEVRREAEVVRQVRESDVDHHRGPLPSTETGGIGGLTSPNLGSLEVDDMVIAGDDAMMVDSGLSSSYKLRALRNLRGGRAVWGDNFSEGSSTGAATTPPPPPLLPRGSSNGDDMSMDSPSAASGPTGAMLATGGIFPMTLSTARSSSGGDTPQQQAAAAAGGPGAPPSAAEITRRINSKRRRDDDFDPGSFKRRAVSPGLSAHNSPIMQSPLQRDMIPWGSRPGSNGHDRPGGGGSSAPSESGGSQGGGGGGGRGNKGRVGYQGMVDTNDGITKLSID